MALQKINVGTGPDTPGADPLRAAYQKINANADTTEQLFLEAKAGSLQGKQDAEAAALVAQDARDVTLPARDQTIAARNEVIPLAAQVQTTSATVESARAQVATNTTTVASNTAITVDARNDAVAAAANTTANLDAAPIFFSDAELIAYTPADRKPAILAMDDGNRRRGVYRRTAGAWPDEPESDTVPGIEERTKSLESVIGPAPGDGYNFVDAFGFVMAQLSAAGYRSLGVEWGYDGAGNLFFRRPDGVGVVFYPDGSVSLSGMKWMPAPGADYELGFVDPYGLLGARLSASGFESSRVKFGLDNDGNVVFGGNGAPGVVIYQDGTASLAGARWSATTRTDYEVGIADRFGLIGKFVGIDDPAVRWSSTSRTDYDLGIADEHGLIGKFIGVDDDTGAATGAFTDAEIAAYDAQALASRMEGDCTGYGVQRPLARYSIIPVISQSYGNGSTDYPVTLTTTARFGNLMLGNSVRGSGDADDTWEPNGTATLKPLVAFGRDTPIEGALTQYRWGYLEQRFKDSDPDHQFIGIATGVGGITLEELSYGAPENYFNRIVTGVQAVKDATDALSATLDMPVALFIQGQSNYLEMRGSTGTKVGYRLLLDQWRANFHTHVVDAILPDQARPPLIVLTQTTGEWTRDDNNLGVGMAQLEFAAENNDVVLAGPDYFVPNNPDGHLTSNGYRWLGMQIGKVAAIGPGWRPHEIIGARQRGTEMLVSLHVPRPPVRFKDTYVVYTATMYAAKGFYVFDGLGGNSILNVEIVGDATIKLTLAREAYGTAYLRYADKTHFEGGGNVCDSDPTVSEEIYLVKSGMAPEEDIPELSGKPYPLNNWLCAGEYEVEQV